MTESCSKEPQTVGGTSRMLCFGVGFCFGMLESLRRKVIVRSLVIVYGLSLLEKLCQAFILHTGVGC